MQNVGRIKYPIYADWIDVKKNARYPVYNHTISITTDGVYGGDDVVYFTTYEQQDDYNKIGRITWRFKDWSYFIDYCTPYAYSLKFTKTPTTEVNKTWEITMTTDGVRIKCNKEEVLHFVYNDTYDARCTTEIRNKEVEAVLFDDHDVTKKLHHPADENGIILFEV